MTDPIARRTVVRYTTPTSWGTYTEDDLALPLEVPDALAMLRHRIAAHRNIDVATITITAIVTDSSNRLPWSDWHQHFTPGGSP